MSASRKLGVDTKATTEGAEKTKSTLISQSATNATVIGSAYLAGAGISGTLNYFFRQGKGPFIKYWTTPNLLEMCKSVFKSAVSNTTAITQTATALSTTTIGQTLAGNVTTTIAPTALPVFNATNATLPIVNGTLLAICDELGMDLTNGKFAVDMFNSAGVSVLGGVSLTAIAAALLVWYRYREELEKNGLGATLKNAAQGVAQGASNLFRGGAKTSAQADHDYNENSRLLEEGAGPGADSAAVTVQSGGDGNANNVELTQSSFKNGW